MAEINVKHPRMAELNVKHPRYGRGTAILQRNKGFEIRVLFEDGTARWVRRDELSWLVPNPPPPPGPPDSSDKARSFQARRMIEAFRLGIVPYDAVQEFTFGRAAETEQVNLWLASDQRDENSLMIVGDYGTGKTHLLNYIYCLALNQGYAVARLELDVNEAPFHKPKRVYHHLVQNFRYPTGPDGQSGGFREFVKEAAARNAFDGHPVFQVIRGNQSENYWEWLEGSEYARPFASVFESIGYTFVTFDHAAPALYDYGTTTNVYCNLLTLLGWTARQVMDLKGLVLILDEAEVVDSANYGYQAQQSQDFLRALIKAADNERELLGPPAGAGLTYCRMGVELPFLHRQPASLKLVFAFTPTHVLQLVDEVRRARQIRIEALSDKALRKVFGEISMVYRRAYNFRGVDSEIGGVMKHVTSEVGRTRRFVKAAVEALDLVRLRQVAQGIIRDD